MWGARLSGVGIGQHSRTICQMVPTGRVVLTKRPRMAGGRAGVSRWGARLSDRGSGSIRGPFIKWVPAANGPYLLSLRVVVLDGFDGEVLGLEAADAEDGGLGAGEVGAVADLVGDGAAADGDFVGAGFVAAGGVDDETNFVVLHHVHDVGTLLLGEFVDAFDGDTVLFEEAVGASGGVDGEVEFDEVFGDLHGGGLVAVVDGEEDVASSGEGVEGADLGFGVGHAEVIADAHHFAGGPSSRVRGRCRCRGSGAKGRRLL